MATKKKVIPLNLRCAKVCMNCYHSKYLLAEYLCYCEKYEQNVGVKMVCDFWRGDDKN